MVRVAKKSVISPVALTDEATAMADYVRSVSGRAALRRGLSDVRAGRVYSGKGALKTELTRRAERRRS